MEVSLRGVCATTLMLTRVWFGALVLRMVVLVVSVAMSCRTGNRIGDKEKKIGSVYCSDTIRT